MERGGGEGHINPISALQHILGLKVFQRWTKTFFANNCRNEIEYHLEDADLIPVL